MKWILPFILCFFGMNLFAKTVETFSGTAYNKKNKVAYVENHSLTLSSNKKLLSVKTDYSNEKGEAIGFLKTDFSNSVSAPAYEFRDFRSKTGHGIRYDGDSLILVKYKKNGQEKTKILDKKKASKYLVIGGQGFHYYLTKNFDKLSSFKNVPVMFLTPGRLSYYRFKLNYLGLDKENLINLEIKVSNLFLRVFAPRLLIKYNPVTRRLVSYEGLSNIKNENGKNQSVKIIYGYKNKP